MQIEFRSGFESDKYLVAGWAGPEREFTWSLDDKSLIVVPAPEHQCDYGLELRLFPFTSPVTPFQRLRIIVNGGVLTTVMIRGETTLEVIVPWTAIVRSAELGIELDHPDAGRPSENGIFGDERKLAVAIKTLHLRAILTPGLTANKAAADKLTSSSADDSADIDNRDLALSFESLGVNCEFGNVQSEHGAEPLGLLRWAFCPYTVLMAMLEGNFVGLGEKDRIKVGLRGDEYFVTDLVYGLSYHTWQRQETMSLEAITQRETRRIPFLVRKLLEELASANKIFVFHDAGQSGEVEKHRLLTALRRYGPNTLLWITLAASAEQVGVVTEIEPGLMLGFVEYFAPLQEALREKTALASWASIIRSAHRLARANGTSSVAVAGS